MLAARALTEGTERYDAVELTEATERLGASLHAEAGWDATSIGIDVPSTRLEPALELLAEVLLHPTFPRGRDRSTPRRAAQRPAPGSGRSATAGRRDVHRHDLRADRAVSPPGGRDARDRRAPRRRPLRAPTHGSSTRPGRRSSSAAISVARTSPRSRGDCSAAGRRRRRSAPAPVVDARRTGRLVRVVHRPGASRPRSASATAGCRDAIPDYHAVTVMGAILGGLFNSRLNMQLREAKGYTYGAGPASTCDAVQARSPPGPPSTPRSPSRPSSTRSPSSSACATTRVTDEELAAARDFLVGVFPLRFETAGAVVGSLSGLAVHGLPIEELTDYRQRVEAVDVDAVAAAARDHLMVDDADIVLVGDVDAFGSDLEAAGLGSWSSIAIRNHCRHQRRRREARPPRSDPRTRAMRRVRRPGPRTRPFRDPTNRPRPTRSRTTSRRSRPPPAS